MKQSIVLFLFSVVFCTLTMNAATDRDATINVTIKNNSPVTMYWNPSLVLGYPSGEVEMSLASGGDTLDPNETTTLTIVGTKHTKAANVFIFSGQFGYVTDLSGGSNSAGCEYSVGCYDETYFTDASGAYNEVYYCSLTESWIDHVGTGYACPVPVQTTVPYADNDYIPNVDVNIQ